MYDIEQYYNAKTVSEAVMLLKEHPDARIISGGSDVLIKIREGRMAGTSLVSIRDIEEIKGITGNENGDILIGAGTVFSHITADPIIQKYIPVLGEAVVPSVLIAYQRFFPTIHFCILQMKMVAELHRYGNFIWDRDA